MRSSVKESSVERERQPIFARQPAAYQREMSVVVVDDLKSLEEHVAAWEDLAEQPLEPNPFYEAWMLMPADRKSTRLNSSHIQKSRMPSSA